MKWPPMRWAGELCAGAVRRCRAVVPGGARRGSDQDMATKNLASDEFDDNGGRTSVKALSLGGLVDLKLDDMSADDRPTSPPRNLVQSGEEEKIESEGVGVPKLGTLDSSVASDEERDTVGRLQSQPKLDSREVSEMSLDLVDLVELPSVDKRGSIKSVEANGVSGNFGEIETTNPLTMSMMSNLSWEDRPQPIKPIIRKGRRRGSTETDCDAGPDVDHGPEALPSKDNEAARRVNFARDSKLQLSRRSSWIDEYQDMNASVRTMAAVAAPRDADDFNNEEEMESNKRWKVVAGQVDDLARVICPAAFIVALAIILGEIGTLSD